MRRLVLPTLVALALLAPAAAQADPTASISGTLRAVNTGQPVSGFVEVYDQSTGDYAGSTSAGSNGLYTVGSLAGGSYVVEFDADGYLTQYYSGRDTYASANAVTVADAQAVTGIDADLHAEGSITGTITDASGPVGGAEVSAVDANGDEQYAQTDSNGRYTLASLPSGSYTVEAQPPFGSSDAPEYYDQKVSAAQATPVGVSLDTTTANIDITLPAQATISGIAADAQYPGGTCNVTARLYDSGGSVLATQEVGACGSGSGQGTYTFAQLPAGTYRVGFSSDHSGPGQPGDGDLPAYYGGSSLAAATAITVAPGDAYSGASATLPTGASVSGTVITDTGAVASYAQVTATDSSGATRTVQADAEGNYLLEGLASDSYVVDAGLSSYRQTYYPQATSAAGAQSLDLTAPQSLSRIDLTLALAEGVTGAVSTPSGAPLAGMFVSFQTADGTPIATTTTAANGRYDLPGSGESGYVDVSDPSGRYESAYDGGGSLASASELSRPSGGPPTVANVVLNPTPSRVPSGGSGSAASGPTNTGSAAGGGTGTTTVISTGDGSASETASTGPDTSTAAGGVTLSAGLRPIATARFHNAALALLVTAVKRQSDTGAISLTVVCGAPTGCPLVVKLTRGHARRQALRRTVALGRHTIVVGTAPLGVGTTLVVASADGVLSRVRFVVSGRSARRAM